MAAASLLLLLAAGAAPALTIQNLKGHDLQEIYGTYGPRGDCRREPRVTVDDSGFTYTVGGRTTHSGTIEFAISYGPPDYHGISRWFFPFPVSDGDFGRVLLTVNPDEKAGTLQFESDLGPGQSLSPLQAALVRNSPYARCGARAAAADPAAGGHPALAARYPIEVDLSGKKIALSPAQDAAVRRATAGDLKDALHPDQPQYVVGLADLNGDGRPDLVIQGTYAAGACGSSGCSGTILMATAGGYASKGIELPNFGTMAVLQSMHGGMHDLQFNGDSPIWRWNGTTYAIAPSDLPGANAPAWTIRQAAGHPLMAIATPIDSTIKNLLVFCEQGTPLLAMVTRVAPPAGPATLTLGFRGWTVNVPMQQNPQNPQLWVANLSRSDLPLWFAHRGNTPTTDELARLADTAYLRINGGLQGQISLANSTATTQAALRGCYRY